MIVRLEKVKSPHKELVVDENGKVIGEIDKEDFITCMLDEEPFEEDGYRYFYVNKGLLMESILK